MPATVTPASPRRLRATPRPRRPFTDAHKTPECNRDVFVQTKCTPPPREAQLGDTRTQGGLAWGGGADPQASPTASCECKPTRKTSLFDTTQPCAAHARGGRPPCPVPASLRPGARAQVTGDSGRAGAGRGVTRGPQDGTGWAQVTGGVSQALSGPLSAGKMTVKSETGLPETLSKESMTLRTHSH